jgi:hypothetical protein
MNIEKDIPKFTLSTYNKFYWHRRFKPRQTLHELKPLIERIKNGDFNYSDYRVQALYELELAEKKANSYKSYQYDERDEALSMGRTRYRKLMEDFMKDEFNITKDMEKAFMKTFWISKEDLYLYIDKCEGGLLELYELINENTLYKRPC